MTHPTFRHLVTVLLLALIAGCASQRPSGSETPASASAWVDQTLAAMTLEEKAAQLIHVWTLSGYYPEDSDHWKELERLVVERKIGGFIFSIGQPYEYAVQINKLQKLSKVPLLIGVDFEWGAGMRLKEATIFPRTMAIGATRNPKYAYDVGYITGLEGRALGVHQNYAPTVDVNNNPRNPVINTRAFGDDVDLVTEMGVEYVKGTQDAGIISTVKHFPGHGDTDVDTHLGLSTLNFSKGRLDSLELPPFTAAFNAGVRSVMVGHLSVPAYDTASGIPATVSPFLTTGLLQERLGFKGLVVTDAMVMEGVASKYHPAEAVILAIKAGIDLVLMPVDADIAIDALVEAVQRGEITEARLDHSVRKLLQEKAWCGLHANRYVDVDKLSSVVNVKAHHLKALEIARKAVTVLGNSTGLLPLSPVDDRRLLDVVISDDEQPDDGRGVHQMLRERWAGPVSFARVNPGCNPSVYDTVVARAARSDVILLQMHLYTRSGAMSGFVDSAKADLVKRLKDLGKPMIGVSFGNPYICMDLPTFDTYVCTYSDAPVMQQALVEVMFAEEPAHGKLPITIPSMYMYGEGVSYPKMRLRQGDPLEVGADPALLRDVDAVMQQAVRDTAFPGAVLLAAKDGVIFYEKAFGGFTYDTYPDYVRTRTVYDLASVTKVIATTSAVMRLVDDGKIALSDKVTKYIPEFGANGKQDLTVYNLMVHNGGLPAWRKFYEFCDTPECVLDSIWATPLEYTTGEKTVYSDLGLISMGVLVRRVSGKPLDMFVDSVFFRPLGMRSTRYNPPGGIRDRIAPTEVDTYWQKTGEAVQGRVHDENAATLGGVSGHAGLFSNAGDLAVLMQMLLNGGTYGAERFLKEETIREFTRRQSDQSSRGIGWDTKSEGRSWSGQYSSMRSFLHTGFTGTSVLADPENNLIVILLTNRVYPTRDTRKIFQVRPAVHEAIYRAIGAVPAAE